MQALLEVQALEGCSPLKRYYMLSYCVFDRNDLNYPKVIDIIKLYNIRKGFVLERTWTKNH